ncbi:DUF3467 domain-containing protein [Verrucomicrobium sp. BvORR034]|uniref:DUF3467 domain-containing protein n=1 Tax=Verrucomicrobium sp. BvORR034 TaxID=1396418 RepID=UPI000A456F57|nr:DUF3467 domain-containing protein [Verrucomicrobium sp. BvORR034]
MSDTKAKSAKPAAGSDAAGDQEELKAINKPNVQILYEETGALFANQVIVNSGRDQIVLDFSTGIISDHNTGRHVLPIQKRIALTPANALKLVQTLSGVIQKQVDASRQGKASA